MARRAGAPGKHDDAMLSNVSAYVGRHHARPHHLIVAAGARIDESVRKAPDHRIPASEAPDDRRQPGGGGMPVLRASWTGRHSTGRSPVRRHGAAESRGSGPVAWTGIGQQQRQPQADLGRCASAHPRAAGRSQRLPFIVRCGQMSPARLVGCRPARAQTARSARPGCRCRMTFSEDRRQDDDCCCPTGPRQVANDRRDEPDGRGDDERGLRRAPPQASRQN
jgi:hypothetical protein